VATITPTRSSAHIVQTLEVAEVNAAGAVVLVGLTVGVVIFIIRQMKAEDPFHEI
jgi:hypothetical protein